MQKKIIALGITATLVGCTAVPTVEYTKIAEPKDVVGDEIDSFSVRTSKIVIDKADEKKDAAGKIYSDFSINAPPAEYAAYKVGVRKADSWGVRTNFNLTKLENSSLPKEVGIEVVDSRVDLITKYGGAITKIIALVPAAAGDLSDNNIPKTIEVTVLLTSGNVGRDAVKSIDAADGVTLDIGPVPVDAVEASKFSFPSRMSGIMYSACRDAVVHFTYQGHRYQKTVKISDPRYFSKTSFPQSGKISFHSECGVSVLANKDTSAASDVSVVEALATQGKAIKDALDAANKNSAEKSAAAGAKK